MIQTAEELNALKAYLHEGITGDIYDVLQQDPDFTALSGYLIQARLKDTLVINSQKRYISHPFDIRRFFEDFQIPGDLRQVVELPNYSGTIEDGQSYYVFEIPVDCISLERLAQEPDTGSILNSTQEILRELRNTNPQAAPQIFSLDDYKNYFALNTLGKLVLISPELSSYE